MIETTLVIKKIISITDTVYSVVFAGDIPTIGAGQFIHIKIPGFNLRRPFCVYRSDSKSLEIIVAEVGKGTSALRGLSVGDKLAATLPLGNGFPTENVKRAVLLGGGTGVAPLLKIAEDTKIECHAYLGFRSAADVLYDNDFKKSCSTCRVFTNDGSYGEEGFPTDAFKLDIDALKPDAVYVCGPAVMIKAVVEKCKPIGIKTYASLEARMGCGVGACLVCSVPIMENGRLVMKRACADGPVFDASTLVL